LIKLLSVTLSSFSYPQEEVEEEEDEALVKVLKS